MARTYIGNFKGSQGPQGDPGQPGPQGDPGVSIVSVTQTQQSSEDEGINKISVLLSNNVRSEFQIKNGSKGEKGEQGDPGKASMIICEAEGTEITLNDSSDYPLESFTVFGKTEKKESKIVITKQPVDAVGGTGQIPFSIEAVGNGLNYKWQWAKPGDTSWRESSSPTAITPNYNFVAGSGDEGDFVRCLVTDASGKTVFSDVVRFTLTGNVDIVEQPLNTTVAIDQPKPFTVKARGAGLKYQWQYRRNSSDDWTDSGAVDSGAKSPSYSPSARVSNDNLQLRCVVTNATGQSAISNVAYMRIGTPTEITTQPQNLFINDGKTGIFSIVATGSNLSYKWQFMRTGENVWNDSTTAASSTPNYNLGMRAVNDGIKIRCKITDGNGSVVYSDVVEGRMPHYALYSVGDDGNLVVNEHGNNSESKTIIIPLDAPLNGINGIKDELGDGQLIRRIGVVDLGSLSWSMSGEYFYSTTIADLTTTKYGDNLLCSLFTAHSTVASALADKEMMCANQRLYIKDLNYANAPAFKSAMAGVMLYYELATPTVTEPTDEQIEAMKFETFKPMSVITNVDDAEMKVKYIADTKAYIDNKFNELATALIASASEAE